MEIPRRTFLAASSSSLFGFLGLDLRRAEAWAQQASVTRGKMTRSICPYCAVGCGMLVTSVASKVVQIEGDPDHPINRGSLCAKGFALVQLVDNPRRVTKVKYRAAKGSCWEEKDWDWAIRRIAEKIQHTRDAGFRILDGQGRKVHRAEGLAVLGGASLNNEECYLLGKLARALGVVYLEHQARICHSSTVTGLAATLGRGAMTNHWTDLANADCLLLIGANPAENHPLAMKWIQKAKDRGAMLISVDPRFTRTSAVADLYAPLRPGTDIALIGGLIHYVLENDLAQRDYLLAHTDAARLVDPAFACEEGRFGRMEDGRYTREHWAFQRDERGRVKTDPTLKHPDCVFQRLKRHFSRYTAETVSKICGTPVETLRQVYRSFAATGQPGRAGTILYSMGATQHTHGTQNVRSYAILQLLLGNIGIAGGGINALRGQANVQGSTDHGLLFDLLPGYLKSPTSAEPTLADYLRAHTPATSDPQSDNLWQHLPKYMTSLLKAWWGEHATAANQFAYDYLPKRDGDASYLAMFDAIHRGQVRGLLVFGQNPAVSGPDAGHQRSALEKLDWLVLVDLWETETAAFWKRPGAKPEEIRTEVFLLPGAASFEKEGSVTNSGRWAQWRSAAVEPAGNGRSDLWILDRLAKELKRRYATGGTFPQPIVHLAWNYGEEPSPHAVAREINGSSVSSPADLRADGSTAAGNWLYCGSYTAAGNAMTHRRAGGDWAWSWPGDCRILYNRAGCDSSGKPWSRRTAAVAYDWPQGKWLGDRPDGAAPPPQSPGGTPLAPGRLAFTMLDEGRARLFAPSLADGPFPEHYEPLESPVVNLLSPQQNSPILCLPHQPEDSFRPPLLPPGERGDFPIVATTCRVGEHWLAGAMSRNLPWLVELVPDAFVEISRELAAKKGIANGDRVTIRSARGEITVYALVTGRLKPLALDGKTVEQVAIVWNFGYQGLATGDSANLLTPRAADGPSLIPEYKAFLCDLEKAAAGTP
jgi:formate dehydrogenase major subunit